MIYILYDLLYNCRALILLELFFSNNCILTTFLPYFYYIHFSIQFYIYNYHTYLHTLYLSTKHIIHTNKTDNYITYNSEQSLCKVAVENKLNINRYTQEKLGCNKIYKITSYTLILTSLAGRTLAKFFIFWGDDKNLKLDLALFGKDFTKDLISFLNGKVLTLLVCINQSILNKKNPKYSSPLSERTFYQTFGYWYNLQSNVTCLLELI